MRTSKINLKVTSSIFKIKFFVKKTIYFNKMKVKNLLFLKLTFLFFSVNAQDSLDNSFSFKWDTGFKLESQDKDFKLKFGGRLMYDYSYINQNSQLDENFEPLENPSNVELRRARMFISGTVYKNMLFKIDADISNGKVDLKDVHIGLSDLPGIGTILLGRFKEPLSLSNLTSSNKITFLERPENQSFGPTRNTGVMIFNEFLNNRLAAQFAVFKNGGHNDHIKVNNNGYAIDSRVTGIILKNSEMSELLHIGVSHSYRKPKTKEYKISPRLPAHMAPKYISSNDINGINYVQLLNFESFYIRGPFSLQAEYLNSSLKTQINSLNLSSYYGQVSYFLTGEHRSYKNSFSPFGIIKPKRNFIGREKGWGALELALRYSASDLIDENIIASKQTNFTLGLNWYLNPISRIMVNQVWADMENMGKVNITQVRLQVRF